MVLPTTCLDDVYDSIHRLSMIRENLLTAALEEMPCPTGDKVLQRFHWLLGLCDDCLIEELDTLLTAVNDIRTAMIADRS